MSDTIVGIDYSLNGPGICVCDIPMGEFSFENCILTYASVHPRWAGKEWLDGQIIGHAHFDSDTENMDRYIHLANITCDAISDLSADHDKIHPAIEDYAFSQNGQLTTLGENAGICKYRILEEFGEYTKAYTPTTIKAFARKFLPQERIDGKLIKMTKNEMHDAFMADTGIDLRPVFGVTCVLTKGGSVSCKNPIPDIVDAYWIAKYHHTQLKKGKK